MNYSKIGLICLLLLTFNFLKADCTATRDGDWSDPAIWSCGRAPADYDIITIPAGIRVTMDINSPTYVDMVVNIDGTLFFEDGQKLNLDCGGQVNVSASGKLDGGNPGSKINICGET
ncbi:MAG TPA: G8 domain-containing protein, partial [Bacteroidia bacterium]|nr:G8 domain-containing protein [Bacteroidia bacterium]